MIVESPGKRFRQALTQENPLLLVGTINAYVAVLAEHAGFKAIYLSGAGVANACYALPDLGLTSLADLLIEAKRITSATNIPLIVDGDTGFGSKLNVIHTIESLIKVGVAGVHLEDQTWPKRCGHRDGKKLVSTAEMTDKLKAACDTRNNIDKDFVIIARTDAIAVEGLDSAIARAKSYVDIGADLIFAEAVTDISQYEQFKKELPNTPIIANITEFGKTPLFSAKELEKVGVGVMLYPLSVFRAMNFAAKSVFAEIKTHGTQKNLLKSMETREELYENLDYYKFEEQI